MAKVPILRSSWNIDPSELASAQERTEARLADLFSHPSHPLVRTPHRRAPIIVDGVELIGDPDDVPFVGEQMAIEEPTQVDHAELGADQPPAHVTDAVDGPPPGLVGVFGPATDVIAASSPGSASALDAALAPATADHPRDPGYGGAPSAAVDGEAVRQAFLAADSIVPATLTRRRSADVPAPAPAPVRAASISPRSASAALVGVFGPPDEVETPASQLSSLPALPDFVGVMAVTRDPVLQPAQISLDDRGVAETGAQGSTAATPRNGDDVLDPAALVVVAPTSAVAARPAPAPRPKPIAPEVVAAPHGAPRRAPRRAADSRKPPAATLEKPPAAVAQKPDATVARKTPVEVAQEPPAATLEKPPAAVAQKPDATPAASAPDAKAKPTKKATPARAPKGRRAPAAKAVPAARTPAAPVPAAALCPYCARLLQPPPSSSRRCPRCKQQIVVKRVEGHVAFLTEAAVAIFEAERRKEVDADRFGHERERWLKLAATAGAPAGTVRRLGTAHVTEEAVEAARMLYMTAVDKAYQAAKRQRRWEEAAKVRRDQAQALHRVAGSPKPPLDEHVALFREGVAAELRGLGQVLREAELVGGDCCETCRVDGGRTVTISKELASPSLPHQGCPRGLCRCSWDIAARDREAVLRYLHRRPRPTGRPGVAAKSPGS